MENDVDLKKKEVLKMSNMESNLFTKECIRTALLYLMGVKAFEQITVTEVIKRAGVSRGGFYRNYQSKEEVLQEICSELLRYILDYMTEHRFYENTRLWLIDFFRNIAENQEAYKLLETLAQKDLRDTPKSVLDDYLYSVAEGETSVNVWCPRVDTELLRPYREYFKKNIPESLADTVVNNTALFVKWCKDNLMLHDHMSLRYVQLDPKRVWESRLADKGSREIFFVTVCRSLGVAAWMDPITRVVKYTDAKDSLTYDVDFDAVEQVVAPKGKLKLNYRQIPLLDDPKYQTHFTISKYVNGEFQLQNYKGTWNQLFSKPAEMDCGYYMLVSGSRMSGGNVFADIEYFTVEEGKTTTVDLVMRDVKDQIRVIGSFDSEAKYYSVPAPGSEERVVKSVLETTGRGYFAVALVDYGTEPVNHAFMDISAAAKELEQWGRPILIVFASEEDFKKFRPEHFNLPSNVHYGIDKDGYMRDMVATEMKLDKGGRLPLIVLADTFNRVVFFSQGYSIGLGDRLVFTSKAL